MSPNNERKTTRSFPRLFESGGSTSHHRRDAERDSCEEKRFWLELGGSVMASFPNFEGSVMRRSRYTEAEMTRIIEKYKSGVTIDVLCQEHGISISTFYAWKLRLGCEGPTELNTVQRLQKENRRLRRRILELNDETDRLKGTIRIHQSTSRKGNWATVSSNEP
jgi:putative transposase